MRKGKMHIFHIEGAVAFVSVMHKANPSIVRILGGGRGRGHTDAFSDVVMGIFKVHHLIRV